MFYKNKYGVKSSSGSFLQISIIWNSEQSLTIHILTVSYYS